MGVTLVNEASCEQGCKGVANSVLRPFYCVSVLAIVKRRALCISVTEIILYFRKEIIGG